MGDPENTSTFVYESGNGRAKYLQLSHWLDKWIRRNGYEAGNRLPSDRQLAHKLHLSPQTVNRSLNELAARGLVERRVGSGTFVAGSGESAGRDREIRDRRIGLLCHEEIMEDGCYISTLLRTLYAEANKRQWELLRLVRPINRFFAAVHDYKLAGVVVVGPPLHFDPVLQTFLNSHVPITVIGCGTGANSRYYFATDHRKIAADSVEYFHRLGHRKIGIVLQRDLAGEEGSAIAERRYGYGEGMWSQQLPVNPAWMIESQLGDPMPLEKHFRALIAADAMPTALLIAQHSDILPLFQVLKNLNMRVPEDISLLAFDSPPHSEMWQSAVTAWRQDVASCTMKAIEALELQMKGLDFPGFVGTAVLQERDSCAKFVS